MRSLRITLIAAILAASGAQAAFASAYEQYCDLSGYRAPLRQTLIILDESQVFPETLGKRDDRNAQWRGTIGKFLMSGDASLLEENFSPRERVTILLARKDGSGVRTVFTGCLPFFSSKEKQKIKENAGAMRSIDDFFGTGPIPSAKKDMDIFRIRIGDSFNETLDPTALSRAATSTANLSESGLISSLKQTPFVDLHRGLARLVFVSDMGKYFSWLNSDRAKARRAGIDQGTKANLNLKGSEVYLVGQSGRNPAIHDALETFFLQSRAELIATSPAGSLPNFSGEPISINRFQGLIDYPENQFPMRMRLATDQNGTLVSSWIFLQANREQFVPIHGVLTCTASDRCAFAGDDLFAQLWNPARGLGKEPVFDGNMPFGGARTLTFNTQDAAIVGSISDPQVHFEGTKNYKLNFKLTRQAKALF